MRKGRKVSFSWEPFQKKIHILSSNWENSATQTSHNADNSGVKAVLLKYYCAKALHHSAFCSSLRPLRLWRNCLMIYIECIAVVVMMNPRLKQGQWIYFAVKVSMSNRRVKIYSVLDIQKWWHRYTNGHKRWKRMQGTYTTYQTGVQKPSSFAVESPVPLIQHPRASVRLPEWKFLTRRPVPFLLQTHNHSHMGN